MSPVFQTVAERKFNVFQTLSDTAQQCVCTHLFCNSNMCVPSMSSISSCTTHSEVNSTWIDHAFQATHSLSLIHLPWGRGATVFLLVSTFVQKNTQ